MKKLTITELEAGQRLDKLLGKYLKEAPKSFLYKMMRKKNIVLNGKKTDGSVLVVKGDEITLFLSDETVDNFSVAEHGNYQNLSGVSLSVLYEDHDIILIDKPVGMLSQKARAGDISLVEHLISYLLNTGSLTNEQLQTFQPAICNRLDRNTSGIVVGGKSIAGLQKMSSAFHDRTLQKDYLTIVAGKVEKTNRTTAYLRKDQKTNQVTIYRELVSGCDKIETEYTPLQTNTDYTLLKVKLITGKTHQIRAHLASLNHPIIGDSKYGDSKKNQHFRDTFALKNQLLHAAYLTFPEDASFSSLSGKTFTAPLPKQFQEIVKALFSFHF